MKSAAEVTQEQIDAARFDPETGRQIIADSISDEQIREMIWRPSREMDEQRDAFLDHVRALSAYWGSDSITGEEQQTLQGRLDGLAFSIMNVLDEAYAVRRRAYDNEGNRRRDNDGPDIAGQLHERIGRTPVAA